MAEALAFCVTEHEAPALEVRVNFGVFAGRQATPAEIDDLARSLHDIVDSFEIVAEERHEFGGEVEAMLRQIVIKVAEAYVGDDVDLLCDRVLARAEAWANACIASRADLGDLRD
jgi:hypothetical protein